MQVTKLRELRRAARREHEPFEVTIRPSAEMRDRATLERFARAGVDRVVSLPGTRAREVLDALERSASRVL